MDRHARVRIAVVVAGALLLLASCAHRGDAQAVLRDADRAMDGASFAQAFQPGMAWPRINIPAFSQVLDLEVKGVGMAELYTAVGRKA